MDEAVFIIPVVFITPVLIVWVFQHFAAKKRLEAYKTIQVAIEKGQPVTPETMESMARLRSPIADLRWGIIFMAVAAGFASFATIVTFGHDSEGEDIRRALYGIASFPAFIGLAFLGLHFFANESKRR
ncbi:MAG TPA: DUF6249 domain-containing protein [Hyphomonadaceae bacterium]|jgi:hypothetical protein|nr:DUF6249 domain-containing protein [Hyphomonadaceae bacterium]